MYTRTAGDEPGSDRTTSPKSSRVGTAVGSIMAVIIATHITSISSVKGRFHRAVIIHADAPCIDPYMSDAIGTSHTQQASDSITRDPVARR